MACLINGDILESVWPSFDQMQCKANVSIAWEEKCIDLSTEVSCEHLWGSTWHLGYSSDLKVLPPMIPFVAGEWLVDCVFGLLQELTTRVDSEDWHLISTLIASFFISDFIFKCNNPLCIFSSLCQPLCKECFLLSHYLCLENFLLDQSKVKSLLSFLRLDLIHAALWLGHVAMFQAKIIEFFPCRRWQASSHAVQLLWRVIEDIFPLHSKKLLARLKVYWFDKRSFPRSQTLRKRLKID